MELSKYDSALKGYIDAITMTATQDAQINKALQGVLSLALANFPSAEVYAQGSFATDTMAKPLTSKQGGGKAGEFDIDIAIESDEWDASSAALDSVADAIKDDDTFGDLKIDNTKNSCVRIEYPEDKTGVAFHIDLVPTKNEGGQRSVPDRATGVWKSSDSKLFAEEFNDRAEKQPGLRQTAIILKRLRDLGDLTDDLKSIFILTLVMQQFTDSGSIMGSLLSVLDGIVNLLSDEDQPPRIENPVNQGEDLAARLDDYKAVREFFVDIKDQLVAALLDDDDEGLKAIFGPGFNYTGETKARNKPPVAPLAATTRAFGMANGGTDR